MKTPLLFSRSVYFFFLCAAITAGSLQAARAQYFVLGSSPAIGSGTGWMIADDLNGDGKPDFVTLNFSTPAIVNVVTNNGDGSGAFTPAPSFGMGGFAQCVVAADLNGDNRKDLIVPNAAGNTLTYATNHGDGTFGPITNIVVGNGPRSMVVGDFGRGVIDIVAANYSDQTLTYLTNNGSGVYSSNALYNLDGSPQSIIAADLNGDSKLDLILAEQGYVGVAVLTNKGNGTFTNSATYYLGQVFPTQLAAVDMNGDHKLDIIVSDPSSTHQFWVLTNNGAGQFASNAPYVARSGMSSYVIMDANNDGSPDIVIGSYSTSSLQVFTNNGAGVFAEALEIPVPGLGYFLGTGDVNGDGLADIIAARQNFFADILINTPPLLLNIQPTATNSVVFSWPLSATNYSLQFSTKLLSPTWTTLPNPTATNRFVFPKQPGNIFFRLVK